MFEDRFQQGGREGEREDKEEESNVIPIAVECSLGTMAVYGCADSLLVLVVSVSLRCVVSCRVVSCRVMSCLVLFQ